MKRKSKHSQLGNVFITIGILMIAGAIGLQVYNMWDSTRAAESSDKALEALHKQQEENRKHTQTESIAEDEQFIILPTDDSETEETTQTDMTAVEIDGQWYIGSIGFPALELELPVIADWDYDKMSIAPCRYYGSYLANDMVICGHNYSTFFSRLGNLQTDDDVVFTDVDGNMYVYSVKQIETLAATAIDEMNHSGYDLTIFTCNYSGYARVAVRCKFVEKR